jgi:hypothetical protein
MTLRQVLISGWVVLALMLICSSIAGAEVVGRLTQVEGRVDLLKGGKLPAIPVKVGDTVEPGDVIRTKYRSRAQIIFIDNSLLTLSPRARIAIQEFVYDHGQGKRRAVLDISRGLALMVVNKSLQAGEPDFVIKSQNAIVRVRVGGNEIGIGIVPNMTAIFNFQGRTQVANILSQVSRPFPKDSNVAYGATLKGDAPALAVLNPMQQTLVYGDQAPTAPRPIPPEVYQKFLTLCLKAPG